MGKTVILSLLACLGLWGQQASLEGTVVNALTQTPIAGVHVSLISTSVQTTPEPGDVFGAISDAAGHYSIRNIRPGTFYLNPTHAGFVYRNDRNAAVPPAITLKSGEQSNGYQIWMTPEATIRGYVLDEFGDPVQGASVRVVVPTGAPYGSWVMRGDTDDRGEYRMSGPPGNYYVEASPRNAATAGPPEIRTDGSLTSPYATTYYPGALAIERGKAVEVAAGQDLGGIDIHVARRRSLKISGVVTTKDGAGVRASVEIILRHGNEEASESTTTAPDGSFTFSDLAPSEYRLLATLPAQRTGDDTLRSPVTPVTIETGDASVRLVVAAGETISGTVRVEGATSEKPPQNWTVHLIPLESHVPPSSGGQIAADGRFTITKMIPTVYRVTVTPLPGNMYIGDVLLGGVKVSGDLDLSKGVGGAALTIGLNRDGGQISGSVTDAEGQPVFNRGVVVLLAPDPNSPGSWRNVFTSDSRFAFHGIPPGKYHLFAIDPVQFGPLTGYEPLKPVAARAPEMEIKAGDQILKNLPLSGKDAPDAQ